jgi:hypothetical protein
MRPPTSSLLLVLVLLAAVAACGRADADRTAASATTEPAPLPTEVDLADGSHLRGPVAGSPATAWGTAGPGGLGVSPITLDEAGYVEEEFVLSGDATSYEPAAPLGDDGRWDVRPTATQPFVTRLLVRRPAAEEDFSGVVFVEWLNVSSGSDLDGFFRPAHTRFFTEGVAWVGVSVQAVGVGGLQAENPDRYAELAHPGDPFGYDIFTRAGAAVTDPSGILLGGYQPEAVLAGGASQSANGLRTYVNAVQPQAGVFDGFLPVSATGSLALQPGVDAPAQAVFRTDQDVPVLNVQNEGDLVVWRSHLTRRDDDDHFRLWELAGSAHIADYGRSLTWPPAGTTPGDPCVEPIASGPQFALAAAATAALEQWVLDGNSPPQAPRLELTDPAAPDPIARDEYGNALGGIRYPHVEHPVATIDGVQNAAPAGQPEQQLTCSMSGHTRALSDAQLAELYESPADYVEQYAAAADAAVDAGFLLPADAEVLKAGAPSHAPQA